VTISKADKADEYMRYAEHCLKTADILAERDFRMLHREMAGEWLKLAQDMMNHAALIAPSGERTTAHTEPRRARGGRVS
jgi:hypothetical protein